MNIPFQQFNREYQEIKEEILSVGNTFFTRGYYILGPSTKEFEKKITTRFGFAGATGVANGTDAITLALRSLHIPEGSEVITTPITAYGTILGIERAGYVPVLADIDPSTGLMDINTVEWLINRKTKVILPVHLYGQMVPMRPLLHLARKYKLFIIEDCAQALGAKQQDVYAGGFGHLAAFSFYPTKNLGAYGDGGMVAGKYKKYIDTVELMRNYGQKNRYEHSLWGLNSRLDELQAAFLTVKLKYFSSWIKRRRKIAAYYRNHINTVEKLRVEDENYHTYHLFIIKTAKRDLFIEFMNKKGIAAIIHYPIPVHKQKIFHYGKYRLQHASNFAQSVVSLPLYPQLNDAEVEYVVKTVNSWKE